MKTFTVVLICICVFIGLIAVVNAWANGEQKPWMAGFSIFLLAIALLYEVITANSTFD